MVDAECGTMSDSVKKTKENWPDSYRGVYPSWVEEANPPPPLSQPPPPMVYVGIMAWYLSVLAYAYLNYVGVSGGGGVMRTPKIIEGARIEDSRWESWTIWNLSLVLEHKPVVKVVQLTGETLLKIPSTHA